VNAWCDSLFRRCHKAGAMCYSPHKKKPRADDADDRFGCSADPDAQQVSVLCLYLLDTDARVVCGCAVGNCAAKPVTSTFNVEVGFGVDCAVTIAAEGAPAPPWALRSIFSVLSAPRAELGLRGPCFRSLVPCHGAPLPLGVTVLGSDAVLPAVTYHASASCSDVVSYLNLRC
jgi:hypothetical protein